MTDSNEISATAQPPLALRRARRPEQKPGLPLMEAARVFGIDHRQIWLWAEEGRVHHIDVLEPGLKRPRTYYSKVDLERLTGKSPYPAESVPIYSRQLLAVSA